MVDVSLVVSCQLVVFLLCSGIARLHAATPPELAIEGVIELSIFYPARCPFSPSNITRVVRYRDSDVYSLNTTFRWHDNGTEGLSYEVGLTRKDRVIVNGARYSRCFPKTCVSITQAKEINSSCSFVEQWYNTSTNEITLPAPYSYDYTLYIHPWNDATGSYMPGQYFVTFPYEDCFEITDDKEFCSKQAVEIASAVVNLTGEFTTTKSGQALFTVTFQDPVQTNPENLCSFFVNIANGLVVKNVPWEKPADPTHVYMIKEEVDPLLLSLGFAPVTVKVYSSHCKNGAFAELAAAIRVNYTSLEIEDEVLNVTTVATPDNVDRLRSYAGFFITGIIIAILLVCIGTLVIRRCSRPHLPTTRFDDENETKECLPIFAEKELSDPSTVKYDVTTPVGTGQYGNVYKGELYSKDSDEWTTAAVKVAKEHDLAWREDFVDEIKLILELGPHPNIVKVLGCCTTSNPPLLITEFMRYGDLLHFLHKCRIAESASEDIIYSTTEADLTFIALQVAQGMKYISSSKFYHGDLSARNVLVGEGLVAKISDFGLANDLYLTGYKRMAPGRKRPLRWVSLETLRTGYCSHKSDVWSYGVVLFEIFSLGATPYHDIPIHDITISLQEGYRLPKPTMCPQEVYNTMRECWQESPAARPTFDQLVEIFECLFERRDPSGTSGESFVSDPGLRSVVFHPFFEEDEEPSVPVLTQPLDTGSMMGSDSGVDSVSARVMDTGSLLDSGSIDTAFSLGACNPDGLSIGRQISTENGDIELGVMNAAFEDQDDISGSETLTNSEADEGSESTGIVSHPGIGKVQRQDSGCHDVATTATS